MEIKARKDRQSSTGIVGSPKKGGGGGKGTWGIGGLDDLKAVSIAGPGDPNYDSEDEANEEVFIVKTIVTNPNEVLIQDYLASGDIEEILKALKELRIEPIHHFEFVKKALMIAMEKQAYERELISKLLLAIYNVAVTPERIVEGFQATLDVLDDALLDTPYAVDILSKFIARAIFDEVIAPSFLNNASAITTTSEKCINLSHSLVNQPFRSDRLVHIWGAGELKSVKRLKEETKLIFEEYLMSGDITEVERSVRELNVPHFHPQLVKQALRLAITKENVEERKTILELISHLSLRSDLITSYDITMGFDSSIGSLEDWKLDVPNAKNLLLECLSIAKKDGWLDPNFDESFKEK